MFLFYLPIGSGQTCSKIPTWIKNAINGNGKIVGGLIAPSPIPWQVQVRVSFNSLGTNSFCGGTILDEETILSAAHCFIDQNTGEGIFPLGDTDIIVAGSKNSGTAGPQTIRIKNVINHPNYNRQTLDFDFSIVKLTSPLSFNTNVKPACLPTASFVPGGVAVASGWGSIKTGLFLTQIL
jgi:trypsin